MLVSAFRANIIRWLEVGNEVAIWVSSAAPEGLSRLWTVLFADIALAALRAFHANCDLLDAFAGWVINATVELAELRATDKHLLTAQVASNAFGDYGFVLLFFIAFW